MHIYMYLYTYLHMYMDIYVHKRTHIKLTMRHFIFKCGYLSIFIFYRLKTKQKVGKLYKARLIKKYEKTKSIFKRNIK